MTTEPNTTARRARRSKPPVTPPASPAAGALTKSATVIKLLLRARGATPLELIAATDWQAHSIRAFLSGLRKKGRVLVREARRTGEFAYRLEVAKVELATTPELSAEPTPKLSAEPTTAARP